jgi:hypothetical protein
VRRILAFPAFTRYRARHPDPVAPAPPDKANTAGTTAAS